MDTVIEKTEEVPAILVAPSIGEFWRGGVYAGIIGGIDGQPDYHLTRAPTENQLIGQKWGAAVDGAKAPINGFLDWSLPDRREARLVSINAPEGLSDEHWYWTSEQYSASPAMHGCRVSVTAASTTPTSRVSAGPLQSAEIQSLNNLLI